MKVLNYLEKFKQDELSLNIIGPLFNDKVLFQDPVVFIDGGALHKKKLGFSVGDGDSYNGDLDEVLPQEKDYSDLAYVLSSIPMNFTLINLLGFLGERKDHELINLAEAFRLLKSSKCARKIKFDQEIIALSSGEWSINIQGTFSLFSFEQVKLSLSGDCKYNIETELQALSSHGLSNVGHGKIKIKNQNPLFIFLNKS